MRTCTPPTLLIASLVMLTLTFTTRAADEIGRDQRTSSGIIESIDISRQNLTLKSFEKSMTFRMAADGVITTASNAVGTLADLAVGDQATVIYDAMYTAHRVTQSAATEADTVDATVTETTVAPSRIEMPPQPK